MESLKDKLNKKKVEDSSLAGKFNNSPEQLAPVSPFQQMAEQPLESGLPSMPARLSTLKELDKFSTETRRGLDKEKQDYLKLQADKLKELNDEAKKIYKENKDRVDTAKLGEILGQALTQLGYGMAGLKSGSYGGPLQMGKTDWENTYNNILQEYKLLIDSGKDEIGAESAGVKSRQEERERLGKERINAAERSMYDELAGGRREEKQALSEKNSIKKELEQVNKDKRAVEAKLALLDNAKGDKEKSKILGDILVLLKAPEGQDITVDQLKELKDTDPRAWYDFWSDKPDQLREYTNQILELRKKSLQPNTEINKTVRVQKGTEILEIPVEDIKNAEADGYKRID